MGEKCRQPSNPHSFTASQLTPFPITHHSCPSPILCHRVRQWDRKEVDPEAISPFRLFLSLGNRRVLSSPFHLQVTSNTIPSLPFFLSFHLHLSSWNRMPGKQELGREGMGRERWHVGESGGRWVNDGIHSLSAAFPPSPPYVSILPYLFLCPLFSFAKTLQFTRVRVWTGEREEV